MRTGQVVPAILTDSPRELEIMVRQAEGFTTYVQFDIMDGRFVPSHSVTWKDIARIPMKLSWEAHLMVLHPEEQFAGFKQAGARKVVFHYEAVSSPQETIKQARKLGLEVGIALNPETLVSAVLPLIDRVDSVLFLSVNPGFYGSPFIPEVLDKLIELRNTGPDIEIGIDGGIKENNIAQVAQIGADIIFVGSSIFKDTHPERSFHRLVNLAQQGARLRTR